ncbi:MAG: hypothetical protein H7144_16970 [Burkholderiales bacterium]|nr:hypothetical protein [Phycisphaerae bacterium]
MKDDAIVHEARRAGQAYIDSFNGDWKQVIADLNRRTEDERKSGRNVVSFPPRKPRASSTNAKK